MNDTPYLTLTGELWGVFCEISKKNYHNISRVGCTRILQLSAGTVLSPLLDMFSSKFLWLPMIPYLLFGLHDILIIQNGQLEISRNHSLVSHSTLNDKKVVQQTRNAFWKILYRFTYEMCILCKVCCDIILFSCMSWCYTLTMAMKPLISFQNKKIKPYYWNSFIQFVQCRDPLLEVSSNWLTELPLWIKAFYQIFCCN